MLVPREAPSLLLPRRSWAPLGPDSGAETLLQLALGTGGILVTQRTLEGVLCRIATALALLEPALLATLTGIVGLIALSFFLPLFSLLGGVNAR